MLQFILGRAGAGKTTWVWQTILRRAKAGAHSLLLVPEQFAATADLTGYLWLGDALHSYLKVCSFSTLTARLEDRFGGGALHSITDAGRMVLVRRTLANLADSLTYFGRSRRSARFCADCAEALQQLKYCGVTPQMLRTAAADSGAAAAVRLQELALIFEAYETARAATGLAPVDRLSRAAQRTDPAFFADTACFVDGFGEFTAPETALLACMLTGAPAVYVALTCPDGDFLGHRFTVFSPAAATGRHLRRLAAESGIPEAAPVLLGEPQRFLHPDLAAAERLLAGRPAGNVDAAAPYAADAAPPLEGGIRLYAAGDIYEEAMFVAARAAALARAGVSYEQMTVLCRDVESYLPALQYAFGLYEIPLFTGSTTSAEYAPLSVFLRAALALAKNGLNGDDVLALLKTGLTGADEAALSALENYVYTWRPSAAEWRAPFTRNPAGMDAGQPDAAAAALLAMAEGLRAGVVPAVDAFCAGRGSTGRSISAALYRLLLAVGAPDVITGWIAAEAAAGQGLGGFDAARMWQTVMGFLDEMAALLGEETVSPAEYDELLCVLLRAAEIGQAPHTQNQVQLAAADRARLDNPAHVFVMGLAEGSFPAPIGDSPLLTNDDRARLSALGAPLSGDYENMVLREEMHLYRALTGARQSLTLSWPARRGDGQVLCAPAARLCAALGVAATRPGMAALALTPAAAMELLAARYREDSPVTAALLQALGDVPEVAGRLAALQKAAAGEGFAVRDTAGLRRLLGQRLSISPSRMESYYECPFSYFLQYVLKVRPRPRAELGIPQSGTLVHWLLETLLSDFPALAGLTDERLAEEVHRRIAAYVAEKLPANTGRRFGYLLRRIGENAVRLLGYIRDEQAQGAFVPAALEQPIGDETTPALELCGSYGQRVRIIGTVDRVDTMTRDGQTWLRVVDYKTGSKSFSLDDVCCGINTQMLLYLFSLTRPGAGAFADTVPAGVLYLLSDPTPSADEKKSRFSVDGLVLDDERVLTGMDAAGEGRYLPVSVSVHRTRRGEDSLVTLAQLGSLARHLEKLVAGMADALYEGHIDARPLRHGNMIRCSVCDYRPVCRRREGDAEDRVPRDIHKTVLAAADAAQKAGAPQAAKAAGPAGTADPDNTALPAGAAKGVRG